MEFIDVDAKTVHDRDGDDDEDSLFVRESSTRKKIKIEIPSDDENSVSDDSDVDEEDDDGYTEKQEPFPKHAAYDKDIPKVTSILQAIMEGAKDMFETIECNTTSVARLREIMKATSVFPEHERPIIGFLGAAGEGKSSLVNSLADCLNLAKAAGVGKSCTFVITEYKGALPSQRRRFSVTVQCYDTATARKILSAALDDWTAFYVDSHENWTKEETRDHEDRANTCLTTFQALFSTVDNFRTEHAAGKTLDELTEPGKVRESVLDNIQKLMEDLMRTWRQADGTYSTSFDADDTDELWAQLDPFVTESEPGGEPAPWPLVEQVTVAVKGSRVLDAVTMVDMPGISDINRVRVETTFRYLEKCDHLWVVCRAHRATTDPQVNSALQQYGKHFKGNMAIIATNTDENIDNACAMEMIKLKVASDDYKTQKQSSTLMAGHLKELRKKLKRARNSASEQASLGNDIREAEENLQKIENTRWESVVESRNTFIRRTLRKNLAQHIPPKKKLRVFGISNKHYNAHKGEQYVGQFTLSVNGTGVPMLREYALSIAAPHMSKNLDKYIDTRFALFIDGLRIWASGATVLDKERQALRKIAKTPGIVFRDLFDNYEHSLEKELAAKVLAPLQKLQPEHANFAITVLHTQIKPLRWNTIRAFIRGSGNAERNVLSSSWNELLTEPFGEVLGEIWETFETQQVCYSEDMKRSFIAEIVRLGPSLKNEPAAVTLPIDAFAKSLEGRIVAVRHIFHEKQKKLEKHLRNICMRATDDTENNYFMKAMQEAYETCQRDSGKGYKDRCINTLRVHLALEGDRSPFAILARSIADDVEKAVKEQIAALHFDLSVLFKEISGDFFSMLRKEVEDSTEAPAREIINKFLETARPEFDSVEPLRLAIKARYPAEK